jgi:hypothetical protein
MARSAKATGHQLQAAREEGRRALSGVRSKDQVIAVLASDLHITDKTPVARAEKDWLKVLAYYFEQVRRLCRDYHAPLIVAGDVFDKPNPSPFVINFAMEVLPNTFAIPGQHDLQYHNYADRHKTAYWTLVQAEVITNMTPGLQTIINGSLIGIGFPWGSEVKPLEEIVDKTQTRDCVYLAVVHDYIWTSGYSYDKPPSEAAVSMWLNRLKGYTAAVFGDNHKGFLIEDRNILNAGTFTCRRSDERNYRPHVGLLKRSGEIEPYELDTSKDEWCTLEETEKKLQELDDFTELVDELNNLGADSLDFLEALKAGMAAKQVGRAVGDIIRKAAEKNDG